MPGNRIILILTVPLMFLLGLALTWADQQNGPPTRPAKPSPTSVPSGRPLPSPLRSYVEATDRGDIDWTNGEILARGVGKVTGSGPQAMGMGRRAGRLAAARNAVLLAAGLRIDPSGRRFDIANGKISVEGVLRDFEETESRYDPGSRTVIVTLRVPLYGINGLVDKTGVVVSQREAKWSWSHGEGAEKPARACTDSIIVDARGTDFKPLMFPVLQTERGERIFDASDVPSKELMGRGMVVYAGSDGKLTPPSGSAGGSVMIRPVRVRGKLKGILVLGDSDLKVLAACPECRELMRSGKLIVVIGPPERIATRPSRAGATPGESSQGRATPIRRHPQESSAGETAR